MAKRSNFSKLSQMRESERARALQGNPSLLSGLTPTQIAELFPDYFKRGTPDVGGFYAAISKESAKRQQAWQGSVDSRLDQQGGMLSRMRKEYAGGNYGSTTATGNLKQNQQEAYKAARAEGLSDSAARILVANMSGESLRDPTSHHWDRSHMSQGIVQWDPNRAERIKDHFGAYPKDMSVAQQTKAAIWEMKTYYGASYSALTNEGLSPSQRMHTVVSDYERPQDVGGSVSARMQYYNGLNIVEQSGKGETPQQGKQGSTPGQGGTPTTPGGTGAPATGQTGAKFNVVSGYIVPQDKSLYDSRNASQCATLGKAFNPSIGRSSGWTIVDGDIKAGQVVATKQYNNGGADRVGAGYHTGVALTAPNERGDFLLLEQYNGSGGAKTRWVNKNSYPIGHTGQTTSWGLISSGGKVHDEISQEALAYGEKLGGPNKESVGTNSGTPGQGGDTAPGVEGQVEYAAAPGEAGGVSVGEGDSQSASLMRPVAMMQNLMGMMGGIGGGSASPLGLITTAMGFIMPLIGSIAGERLSGEGMGDGGRRGRKRGAQSSNQTSSSLPEIDERMLPTTREDIGHITRQFESGKYGAASNFGVESISTGKDDPGGVSYGEHQIKSKPRGGTMVEFLSHETGRKYRDRFKGLTPGSPAFSNVYTQIAKEDPKGFAKDQRDFLDITHYRPNLKIAAQLGYNVEDPRMQEALWGGSIQQRNFTKGILRKPEMMATIGKSVEEQIMGYAKAKGNFMRKYPKMYQNRFLPEAQAILGEKPRGFADINVMNKEKYAEYMESEKQRKQTLTAGAEPSQTTPGVGAAPTTVAQTQPPSIMERIFPSAAAEKVPTAAQPPRNLVDAPLPPRRPVTTPGSMNLSAQPAPPGAGITPEAMRSVGISAKPGTSEGTYRERVLNQFGVGNIPTPTATVAPQNNRPSVSPGATPASTPKSAPTVVTPSAQLQAPGPAPDTTAMQMRTQMQTVAMTQAGEAQRPMPQMQQVSQVSHVLNHDQTMKMIQNPADNPSVYRAFARTATGEELPGALGHGHFSNGNSVA